MFRGHTHLDTPNSVDSCGRGIGPPHGPLPKTANTYDRHPCSWRDSQQNSYKKIGRRSSPYTVWPPGSALTKLTYLLTTWCRVLLEKLTGLQLVKKFPAFYGTRRFITALTSVRHLSLSWVSPIQSTYPHPTSWRSIPILTTHLRLGLPSGLFPSRFPTKTLYTPLSSSIRATCPAHLIRTY